MSSTSDIPPLRVLRERALSLIATNKHERAAEVCLAIARNYRAEAGDWGRRAADCLRRVGRIQDEIDALNLAAEGYQEKGLSVKAIAICKTVLTIDPTNSVTRQRLAQLSSNSNLQSPRIHSVRVPLPTATPIAKMQLSDMVPGVQKFSKEEEPNIFIIPLDDLEFEDTLPSNTEKENTIIPKTPLFSDLQPSCFQQLVERSRLANFDDGQVICNQGDPGNDLYIIVHGSAEAVLEQPQKIFLGTLHEGAFFGEIALIGGPPRTATVFARGPTQLLLVGRDAIEELMGHDPSILEVVLRFLRDRLLGQLIARIPLLEPCAGAHPDSFASRFVLLQIEEGGSFIVEGEKSKGLYILMSGEAQAFRSDEHGEYLIGNLGPGDLCGEMSLLSNAPAVATVRCSTRCLTLFLPAKDFREAIMMHSQLLDLAASLAEDRRVRNEEIAQGRTRYEEGRLPLI